MSFSKDVKDDLLRINNTENESYAEALGILSLSSEISLISKSISITSHSMAIIRRLIKMLKNKYDIDYSIMSRTISRFDNNSVFTCEITKNAKGIIDDYRLLDFENVEFETDEEKQAYLRGVFLVKGSVNDPASKSSHLEISYNSDKEIIYIQKLMNYFGLNARITKRKNLFVVYIKSNDAIGEFLYLIGATKSMEYYQNIIITKEIKATTKRTINLDVANQTKTNIAATEQMKYIKYLEYNYDLSKLDNKLLMVMKVRYDNPESSLQELLEIIHEEFEPSLSKSGLNHRLRKLKEIAIEEMEKRNS